jgi:triosephosphate isomerase
MRENPPPHSLKNVHNIPLWKFAGLYFTRYYYKIKEMSKIIVANWKMNPESLAEAQKLAKASDLEGLIICPPFPFIPAVAKIIKKAELGAQDVFWEERGAYTGEVAGVQLKDLGVKYVIVGHSERRKNLGETDEMIAKKIAAGVKAGLTPILCVGETKAEREANKTQAVVKQQLKIGLSLIENLPIKNFIIAYEPVWAIGTGTPDTPASTLSVIQLIKSVTVHLPFGTRVIYGGSVNAGNVKDFLQHQQIEGALVGGASLKSAEIKAIVKNGY